jgi:hypothetical protein
VETLRESDPDKRSEFSQPLLFGITVGILAVGVAAFTVLGILKKRRS